jgi:membrane-bound metal-dependent hydrolase YbcI (DUF457 family)
LADLPVILHIYALKVQEYGGPVVLGSLHETPSHTLLGALILGLLLSVVKPRTLSWCLGSFLGAITHVLLDAVVHTDVQPFSPFSAWNPLYIEGSMGWLSLVLGIGVVFWAVTLRNRQTTDHQT